MGVTHFRNPLLPLKVMGVTVVLEMVFLDTALYLRRGLVFGLCHRVAVCVRQGCWAPGIGRERSGIMPARTDSFQLV